MSARLGNALYVLGCLLALAMIAAEASMSIIIPDTGHDAAARWTATLFIASIFWLVGRACRYVLAGK